MEPSGIKQLKADLNKGGLTETNYYKIKDI
jgi:hypothetical protein